MTNTINKLYGLIGRPLAHSFSESYFTKKFQDEGLADHRYDTFPIYTDYYLQILKRDNENLVGLNVTCLLYTSPSPRDRTRSRMPSSA